MPVLKPIGFLLAVPLLIIGGILLVPFILGVDDLKSCGPNPTQTNPKCSDADAIVVISGGDTQARTLEAIQLYKNGWAPKLILSGAAFDKTGVSNASAMELQAVRAGVPVRAIIKDEYATTTTENASNVTSIVKNQGMKRIILVTSPYHQRRASIEFSRQLGKDITVINHPTTQDRFWSSQTWWLSPMGWWLAIGELVKITYITLIPGK